MMLSNLFRRPFHFSSKMSSVAYVPRIVYGRSKTHTCRFLNINKTGSIENITPSEAFVETLRRHSVENVFGIVGSSFMDPLHSFPTAGIRFISVQHEQNAVHMADGYARASGKWGVSIAQNGPGVSNMVTGVASAYWAHTPVVVITPQCSSTALGTGVFQELNQLPLLSEVTKYQGQVDHPSRMSEIMTNAFYFSKVRGGPSQINIPRDMFDGIGRSIPYSRCDPRSISCTNSGNKVSVEAAVEMIKECKKPFIISGGGVVMGDAMDMVASLAERLDAPVGTSYLHGDAFPYSHRNWVGPLGYMGSRASMRALREADLVVAAGCRLSPFGLNPQYGMDYWPKDAKLIQIDINPDMIGSNHSKRPDLGIVGDVGSVLSSIMETMETMETMNSANISSAAYGSWMERSLSHKKEWEKDLEEMSCQTISDVHPSDRISPRKALSTLEKLMPENAIVSTDIGNICSVANSYLKFNEPKRLMAAMTYGSCGYALPTAMGAKIARPDMKCIAYVGDGAWGMSIHESLTCVRENIPVTVIVFNNGQWGAEKKNQIVWFNNRYIGTQLENVGGYGKGEPNFSKIAQSMGFKSYRVETAADLEEAFIISMNDQEMNNPSLVEVMVTKELGDPFRRDAMKCPVRLMKRYLGDGVITENDSLYPTDYMKPTCMTFIK